MTKKLILWAAVLVIVIAGLLPVLSMLIRSVVINGKITLLAYQDLLQSKRQWSLLANGLNLSVLVACFTTFFGVPIGLLLGKSDLPFRGIFTLIFTIPLLIPPYILAIAWFELSGRQGVFSLLLPASVLAAATRFLFGLGGVTLVLSTIYLPIPMLLTMAFARGINPRLEEAARIVSPWPRVIKDITLPMILPGICLAWLLVFILTLGEYSVPSYLRFDVFSVESFTQFSALYNFKTATAQSLPLAAITLLLLFFEGVLLRRKADMIVTLPGNQQVHRIKLGCFRPYFSVFIFAAAFLFIILPVAGLAVKSQGINFYKQAWLMAGDALSRSLAYAFTGACLLTAVGFFIGYLIRDRSFFCWRFIDNLCLFLFALPGTVLGIGLIGLWNTPYTNIIYGSFLIILLGYVAKYTALTSRITVSQLFQIPTSMDEAAQTAGSGWLRRIFLITIPLSKRGLVAAWLVGFLFCLRDTGITMLVYPPGCETMPVRIFTLMANGAPQLISALCVLMVLAAVVPASLLWAVFRMTGGATA